MIGAALVHPLQTEQYCYLTTRGRKSGREHTVELWFAAAPGGETIYILSGGRDRSDWVKNLLSEPRVRVRVGSVTYEGTGRLVEEGRGGEEERQVRELVVRKYYGREYNPAGGWEAESLPVAIDLPRQAE